MFKKHRSGIYPTTDTGLCFPCCLFHKPTQTHHDPYRLSLCQPRPVVCSTLPRHLSSSRPNLPADKLTTIIKPGLCRSSPSTNPPPTSFSPIPPNKQANKPVLLRRPGLRLFHHFHRHRLQLWHRQVVRRNLFLRRHSAGSVDAEYVTYLAFPYLPTYLTTSLA